MGSNSNANQVISLPKGGGALKGIGETFQANLFSGTGNYSVPIATSPGRNGFGPTLSLQYSSGNGNGLFGLGWQLSIPRITCKTEKGLPKYDDTDVFVMSGAEDLVPCLKKMVNPIDGTETWVREDPVARALHTVYRYRPRTEGLFARIEKWENNATKEVHWHATTKENISSIYGGTSATRVADPEDEKRVYEWLLQETFDDKGNHIRYEYARDNPELFSGKNPDPRLNAVYEKNRSASQRYIRRIYYANLPDPLVDENGNAIVYPDGTEIGHQREGRRYAFEVVFDYGDWKNPTKDPHPNPEPAGHQELFGADPTVSSEDNPVPIRADRFSSYRSKFEIRTMRRCRRVLMFHHFAELGSPTLVRSTDFEYQTNHETLVSLLTAVTVTGYRRDAGIYSSASMPPVTFKYSEFRPHEQRYQSMAARGNDMPPRALNDPDFALVDLFGDGLPDVLHASPAGFRYWRNLGGGRLDRSRSMTQIPAGIALSQTGVGFGDMGGDGRADLLVHSGPRPGFFESTSDGTWAKFKPYDTDAVPSFNLADANVRMVDLTGDGLSDALMTRDLHFLWSECLGERGYSKPKRVDRNHDLDDFPDVYFDDLSGRVRLADMTGDGLNDIVMVHNGRIDYWPNLGYGNFGKRITMENAPHLEINFDPKRLFLADIDGTGCADLVYVDFDRVHFWFNQSGNGWSDRDTIQGTPNVSDVDSIQFSDVFGTGTATLLWSYDYDFQPGGNYKVLDLCGGIKPYVLTDMSNNMGATTRVKYAPSTKYWLEDQANGMPWATNLPFPIHVVDKVEIIDHISKTKLVTTYKYHHGYFDGREREFRGFGRVDQRDTETFEEFTQASLHEGEDLFNNDNRAYHVPPIETRSWFHTGIYFDQDRSSGSQDPFDYKELTKEFRKEFYREDAQAFNFDDHQVETGDTPHEAFRALRGALLRTEVFALDGSAKANHPYVVTESRYQVKQLQPKDGNHHAVYISNPMESLSYHYERDPSNPRISHSLTLHVDSFGNVRKALAIAYGRRQADLDLPLPADQEKQTSTLVTYAENNLTNAIDNPIHDPENYHTPLVSETLTYELTGFKPANNAASFSFGEWVKDDFALLKSAEEINYEETADLTGMQRRLIEQVRTLYRKNDLTDLLPLGTIESMALPGETYKLAFTPGLLAKVFERLRDGQLIENLLPNPGSVLGVPGADRGGYLVSQALKSRGSFPGTDPDDHWWIPAGRAFNSPDTSDTAAQELSYASRHFFLPHRRRDPFHSNVVSTENFITYDPYDLLIVETRDPLGNTATAENDYRLLHPFRMTDPNGNRAEVAFDTLGLVVGTAVMGKITETKGDVLTRFLPDPTPQQLQEFFTDPMSNATLLIGQATTRIVYDLDRYRMAQQPVCAAILARETHVSDPLPSGGLKIQVSVSYSDGFAREIQKKIQAEPGAVVTGGPMIDHRWVGSGWTIFNNKGKPVRQYEPFFDDTPAFQFGRQVGVSSTLFYDPLERVVVTAHPNHTFEKVVFDAWRRASWDVNDTIKLNPKTDPDVSGFFAHLPDADYLPTWYDRMRVSANSDEKNAALRTEDHADTAAIAHFDALGRPFLSIADNGGTEKYATRLVLDIEGNQRAVIDALRRTVMTYDYDLLSVKIHHSSMEAGERWTLNDVAGKSIRGWDSRGHTFRTEYDPLRRPMRSFVIGADPANPDQEFLTDRRIYGEQHLEGELRNLRGKLYLQLDQAGAVTSEDHDFKGNPLRASRRIAREYKRTIDWTAVDAILPGDSTSKLNPAVLEATLAPLLEADNFVSSESYDALNRPVQLIAPHRNQADVKRNIVQPVYNDANLLERIHVWLDVAIEPPGLLDALTQPPSSVGVSNIDYDAKGQRLRVEYKNSTTTHYSYDPETFRLTRLYARRGAAFTEDCENPQPPPLTIAAPDVPPLGVPCGLQNLRYIYDPVGNITSIRDDAQQTIYFRNKRVEPSNDYTYDAVYRLIEATGREHLGQVGGSPIPHSHNDESRVGIDWSANDGSAMGTYSEHYLYDAAGNFLSMRHHGNDPANPGWTRSYSYDEASLIEPARQSNRLSRSPLDSDPPSVTKHFDYDAHGNMTRMSHLPLMQWNYHDQLQATAQQVVTHGMPETTFYVYDAAGQRVRKVTENQATAGLVPTRKAERIYLGGFEVYREYTNDGISTKLERETLHIMDDKQRIALVETKTKDISVPAGALPETVTRYQLSNHLGSAGLELDDQAKIISYEEYTPYGSTVYQAVRSQTETTKRYRYTGKERDEENGLYYHGARYYAAWLGRWGAADPASLEDGPNLYHYCRGNPIVLNDPSGTDSQINFNDEDMQAHPEDHVIVGERPESLTSASSDPASNVDPSGLAVRDVYRSVGNVEVEKPAVPACFAPTARTQNTSGSRDSPGAQTLPNRTEDPSAAAIAKEETEMPNSTPGLPAVGPNANMSLSNTAASGTAKEPTQYQLAIGVSATAGTSLPVVGPFGSVSASVGATSDHLLFLQAAVVPMWGQGLYIGGGASLTVGGTPSPMTPGLNTSVTPHVEANVGLGLSGGVSVEFIPGLSVSGPSWGPGAGAMWGAGPAFGATLAVPNPFFSQTYYETWVDRWGLGMGSWPEAGSTQQGAANLFAPMGW